MSDGLRIELLSHTTEPGILERFPEQAEWCVQVWRKMGSGSRTMVAYRVLPAGGHVESVDAQFEEVPRMLELGEEDLVELLVESGSDGDAAERSTFIHIAGARLDDADDAPASD